MMFAEHLDTLPAPNHCAWTMHFPARDGKPARDLDLVAQWSGGETTADRIGRAEKERDEARAAVAAARREGAEAMREACCREAREWSAAATDVGGEVDGRLARTIANHIRGLPLPGGEP